jgi:hypothetical protein
VKNYKQMRAAEDLEWEAMKVQALLDSQKQAAAESIEDAVTSYIEAA